MLAQPFFLRRHAHQPAYLWGDYTVLETDTYILAGHTLGDPLNRACRCEVVGNDLCNAVFGVAVDLRSEIVKQLMPIGRAGEQAFAGFND